MSRIAAKLNKAIAYHQSGKLKNAEKLYRTVLNIDRDNFDANHLLGVLKYQSGKHLIAKSFLEKALKINPDCENALNHIGLVFHALEQYSVAINAYHKSLKLKPDFVEVQFNLGNTYQACDRTDDAIAAFQKTLLIAPHHHHAINNLANVLVSIGEIGQARQWLEKALQIEPSSVGNLYSFAINVHHKAMSRELQTMEALFRKKTLPADKKMLLAYGLGKAFDDLQNYQKAFEFFESANNIARMRQSYNHQQHVQFHQNIAINFGQYFFDAHLGVVENADTPIFIVGMPRSATSLVEQILASHSEVHGAGELTLMGELCHQTFSDNQRKYPFSPELLKPEQLEQIAEHYISTLMENADPATIGVDKMPYNYHYLGMIAVVFPKAKFIHTCRDPLDNCLSIYQHHFTAGAHPYAHDLSDLGQYYRLYEQLMAHWHQLLPGRIYDLDYKSLVANSENEITKLLTFCGLSFESSCLNFHDNKRLVKTASAIQVRQPINTRGLDRWKNYQDNITSLQDSLGR